MHDFHKIMADFWRKTSVVWKYLSANILHMIDRKKSDAFYPILTTNSPHEDYGNTGCRVFKWGVQNWKDFCLKINIPKENYWILIMGRYQKVPKFDFQSQKSSESFSFFFSLKNINLRARFCYWYFLIISIFKSLNFLKQCPIFDTSPLHQFSKFKNILWVWEYQLKKLLLQYTFLFSQNRSRYHINE